LLLHDADRLPGVSYGWKQEQMAANAQEVSRLAKDLYDRLRVFTNHFADIGKVSIARLIPTTKGVGSLEARVLVPRENSKSAAPLPAKRSRPWSRSTKQLGH